jgi:SAM-dependent methyltransferase
LNNRKAFAAQDPVLMSARFDHAAATFDRHRALPDGTAEAVRAAILAAVAPRPRLLDLGAGTGRIGHAFVAAGDDYVCVDLSVGMVRQFVRRAHESGGMPRLVQSDGQLLPFGDAAFDAVMMIQVFGGLRGWSRMIEEARRVLRPLILGRTVAPADGLDARMKQLASFLGEADTHGNVRENVRRCLAARASSLERVVAAAWDAERTARGFLARHRTGARFVQLPEAIREEALGRLGDWAADTFGSLDAVHPERHEFELELFRFQRGGDH